MIGYAGVSTNGGTTISGPDPARLDLVMQRYAGGDEAAFGEVYEAIAPALFRFCLRMSRGREEARDVFQDSLLRLHRVRASYLPGSPTMGWMFAIARSSYLDRLRRRRRRPEAPMDPETACKHAESRGHTGTPEGELCALEMLVVVDRALGRMSEGNRQAYVLRQREELSVPEAAEALGTSGAVVKQRTHRAHEQIREALRRGGWVGMG